MKSNKANILVYALVAIAIIALVLFVFFYFFGQQVFYPQTAFNGEPGTYIGGSP